jgi:hypothetical protein
MYTLLFSRRPKTPFSKRASSRLKDAAVDSISEPLIEGWHSHSRPSSSQQQSWSVPAEGRHLPGLSAAGVSDSGSTPQVVRGEVSLLRRPTRVTRAPSTRVEEADDEFFVHTGLLGSNSAGPTESATRTVSRSTSSPALQKRP